MRWSIRARLALLYTALLAAALVAFGAGAYWVLGQQLQRSFDTSLAANAEHAAGAFAQDVDASGQLHPTERLLAQLAATGGRVLVLDTSHRVLADSLGTGSPPPPLAAADFADADRDAQAVRPFVTAIGDLRRLTVHQVLLPSGERVGYVVWADSTKPMAGVLQAVGAAGLLGGFGVVGMALIGGYVLARRALSPVADVTETARAISLSGDFAARVDVGHVGDEVGELALAFNEMLAALEQNHQTLQRFLADASHQLRTPLTTIRANLDLAHRPDLLEEERIGILSDARDEAGRMARLISDLLSLARADSGARLEFGPVELDALLVESVGRARRAAPHVRMSVVSVSPVVIDGDGDRLRELIEILLDNAGQYTPAGGSVTVALEVRDDQALVRIEDTGIGLAADDRERLFERLYRSPRAREMRPSGTGLGLGIARWIVESHGGTIVLSSRDGAGTTATVTLPVMTS
ncbi:MAG: HAMP domain-containing sensor histidine kinase [Candidatus Limnocylindrales bacterium]